MSKQTTEKEDVRLLTQDSAKETHNNASNLVENISLGESGLVIRRRGETWFTTIGDTTVTRPTKTEAEQIEQLENEVYSVTTKIAIHVFKTMYEQMKLKENTDRMTQSGL